MGDGAVNEGAFHEGVNMGAIWDLPVVYVVENNLYGASTPVDSVINTEKIADRACAYGIPGIQIDGNDVLKVHETAGEAIERARNGEGPTLLELVTYRITGHSRRDPAHYQPEEEKEQARENEPISRFQQYLEAEGILDETKKDEISDSVDQEVESAVEKAMADPEPAPEDALQDMFVD
jgi:pyruvate dehydrogenase E1 component alpha subunit